jgi:hypothetical protein
VSAAQKILSRLEGVRPIGSGRWMAKSPLRPKQKTGSLSIKELPDGRVLIHDFAGGSADEIVRAVGLQLADLFPPDDSLRDVPRLERDRRPFSAIDAVRALRAELNVVWVLLVDLEIGAPIDDAARQRARLARRRCEALLIEICDV